MNSSLGKRIQDTWLWLSDQWKFAGIVNEHRRLGNPDPHTAAVEELQIRGVGEKMRTEISKVILRSPDKPLDELVGSWIDRNVYFFSNEELNESANYQKSYLLSMSDEEVLQPDALRVYRKFERKELKRILAKQEKLNPEKKGNALGLDEYELRALRGKK